MNDSDYLFPRYAVTLAQVKACKGMTRREASKKLGIHTSSFCATMTRHKLGYIFHNKSSSGFFMPGSRLTIETAMDCKGMRLDEAAKKCRVSLAGFRAAAVKHKMIDLFIRTRQAPTRVKNTATTHRHSTGTGVDLVKVTIDCYTKGCNGSTVAMVWPGSKPDKRRFCPSCIRRAPTYYEEDSHLPRC